MLLNQLIIFFLRSVFGKGKRVVEEVIVDVDKESKKKKSKKSHDNKSDLKEVFYVVNISYIEY
jgi:hypothetical protein